MKQSILGMVVLVLGLGALSLVALIGSRADKSADDSLSNLRDSPDRPEAHSTPMCDRTNYSGDNNMNMNPEPESRFTDARTTALSQDFDKPEPEAVLTGSPIIYPDADSDDQAEDQTDDDLDDTEHEGEPEANDEDDEGVE